MRVYIPIDLKQAINANLLPVLHVMKVCYQLCLIDINIFVKFAVLGVFCFRRSINSSFDCCEVTYKTEAWVGSKKQGNRFMPDGIFHDDKSLKTGAMSAPNYLPIRETISLLTKACSPHLNQKLSRFFLDLLHFCKLKETFAFIAEGFRIFQHKLNCSRHISY